MDASAAAKLSQKLRAKIDPILAGNDPAVQSATLADLTAMWVAGHFVPDDPDETKKLREFLLESHVKLVQDLIQINAQMILARMRKKRN